jgi:hypothetical protein
MFEPYKPVAGPRKFNSNSVSVSKRGTIYVSRDIAKKLDVVEGTRHELYFDRDTNQIAVKFVPAGSNGYSRQVLVLSSGSIQLDGAAFFKQFGLVAPRQVAHFVPMVEGGAVIFEYPKILTSKIARE